ncbi:MAG: type III secretion system cytoplasmic ring protein SctQ [Pseudomonadota bacterium]
MSGLSSLAETAPQEVPEPARLARPSPAPADNRILPAAAYPAFAPATAAKPDPQLVNRLLADRGDLRLSQNGKTVLLRLERSGAVGADLLWLGLQIAGHPAHLGLSQATMRRLTEGLGVGPEAEPELIALLAEARLAPWLTAAETRFPGLEIALSGKLAGRGPDWLDLTLVLQTQEGPISIALSCTSEAAAVIALALEAAAPRRRLGWLPVTGRVRMTQLHIGRSALRDLALGDVVVVGPPSLGDAVRLVFHGGASAPAQLDAGAITLTGPLAAPMTNTHHEKIEGGPMSTPEDQDLAEAKPTATPNASPHALEGVAMPVDVDLGFVTLSVADLDGLAPGQVLDLAPQRGDRVTLRIAGQAIAGGELVDLGGTLGVRITRVAAPERPASAAAV